MKSEFDHAIGQTLRRTRLLRGLTQQQLAEMLRVSFQQIQKYELGTNKISFERLCTLSRLLDVPMVQWLAATEQVLPREGTEHHRQMLNLMQHYQNIPLSEHRALLCAVARAMALSTREI